MQGRVLHDAIAALIQSGEPTVQLREVICLSSCDNGCAAAISAPGKWSYLLGRLHPGLAADLLAYAETYGQSKTGTVLPSRRPASLARVVLGRMPDLSAPARVATVPAPDVDTHAAPVAAPATGPALPATVAGIAA